MSTPGQESGNRNYNPNAGRRVAPNTGLVYANGEVLIDAYVLINLPADEFVAVFGVSQEAPTAVESNQKVNNLIDQFLTAADKLGVPRSNTFVDFITQNRVYNFVQAGDNTIREQLQGFETKKNVAVRYKDRGVLEKLVTAASQASIFDLIKVDYVINDLSKIRNRLFDEAARIVKQKEETYTRALGLAIKRGALLQETYDTHYPGELYQTYTAFESGAVDSNYTTNTRVIRERKSRTSYLEPLDRSAFDAVIGAAGIEPMVQCTLYMKVSYSIAR
ncbi:MAG TPA: SIMPL domain-containing protein [Blastocatellia bacterium]|nr:SIMPL domain-containing protein [Blastocatellia bacterium]